MCKKYILVYAVYTYVRAIKNLQVAVKVKKLIENYNYNIY